MGLRFTDSQQPHYPPVSSFRTAAPYYVPERDAWIQPLPRYSYDADVEFNARAHLAPAPRQIEPWRIGVVQNVLYERILIEYLDEDPYTVTWSRSALDIGSESYRPFYNGPYVIEGRILVSVDGIDREVEYRVPVIAVHEVLYGPRGLGVLYDPWDPSGYSLQPNQILRISMEDQPAHAIRNSYGSELVRAERLMILRFWIIAMGPRSRPVVLGASPPFTLVAWMRLAQRQYRALQPRPAWGSYSLTGTHTRIIERREQIESLQSRGEPLRPLPAQGDTPTPLLTGTSANARGLEWMRRNNLLPVTTQAVQP